MAITSGTTTIVGVFNSVTDAQRAVSQLESLGIARDDISLVANKNAVGYDTLDAADRDKASDVVADAGIGAAIGGVGGLLLSAVGAITLPVIGPILAAGPIAAALTGAGIGAATGGLIGALTESGIPEEHARHYAEGVRRGDVLLTVHASDTLADRVSDILDSNNAVDVDERVRDWTDRGWSGYTDSASPYSDEELKAERSRYSSGYGSSLGTGVSGLGIDKARAGDRDDLNSSGTGATMGTTGMSTAGLGTTGYDASQYNDRTMGDKIRDAGHNVMDKARELKNEAKENMAEMRDDVSDAAARRRRARIYNRS